MMAIIHFLFLATIAVTLIFTYWLSKKFKERFASEENISRLWKKAGIIIAIEIIAWIILAVVTHWILTHPWIAAIVAVIILLIIFARKKREDQII